MPPDADPRGGLTWLRQLLGRRRLQLLDTVLQSRLGAGVAYLAGGEAINLVLSLASFILITRLLGVERYGVWATVLDALNIFAAFAAFGLPLAAVQAIAGPDGDGYVVPALVLRFLQAAAIGSVGLALALVSGEQGRYGVPALLAAPGFLASCVLAACEEALRARNRFRQAAVLENVARLLLVLVVAAFALASVTHVLPRPRVPALMSAWSATWAVALIVALGMVAPRRPASFAAARTALGALGRAAPLLGAITLVGLFRFRVEVVLLGVLRSSAEAAQFAVATRVFTVALVVPKVVVAALFPYLVHARGRSTVGLDRETGRVTLLVLAAGVLMSLLLIVAAPLVIAVTAGSAYRGAAGTARVLAVLIAPGYLTSLLTILLVEAGQRRLAAVGLVLPAVLSYAVEFALVGRYGQTVCVAAGGGAVLVSCALLILFSLQIGVLDLRGMQRREGA